MGDLTIVVSVRLGRTMSQYAMPRNRKLTFVNDSGEDLVIRPKHGAGFPLVDQNSGNAIGTLVVRPGESETVRINKGFAGGEFLYEAQIGSATPEDPIVILERPR
jgi:hypothetical protein